ncbi:MAG: beta-propeller fold lactonase family protein, partial [Cyanobacteria bacterium P01_D01_bin.2]
NDINTLAGAIDVAVSPDGSQVFVVSLTDSAITVFDRDASGELTLQQSITDGQAGANELFGASGVAISPTGDQVFVTSHVDGAITVFDRDASGNLTLRQTIKDGQAGADELFGASSVEVSPDGNQVYVASATDAAVTVFDRNADGTLSFAQVIRDNEGGAQLFGGASDIFAGTGVDGFPAINGFSSITVSPDGSQVFVASFEEDGLTVFDRDASGRLTFNQFIQDQDGNGADELAGALGVVVSPDDQQVLVTGFTDGAITAFNRDLAPRLLSITRQTPATAETNADSLVFRLTFNESILNIDAADFSITGGTTATVSAVSAVSATVYDITVSGGDLADFNGTVGLDLASSQNITDPIGNSLLTVEPATDETYTLANDGVITTAKLTPLSGLEVTGLGNANTVRLQVDQVRTADIGEILIFNVDATGRTQIDSFFLLEGGLLPADYTPAFSLDSSQVTEGQFLEFQLVVDGAVTLATATAISDTQVSLDFGGGTRLTAETFTQTATTNLLVGDATAIDLT